MHKLKAGIAYSDEDPLVIIIRNLTYGTEKGCFAQCQGSSACLGNRYYHTVWKSCDSDMDSVWMAA